MFIMIFDTSARALIAFVTLAIGLGGMAWSSFGVNHLDIGAGYANVLMAYSNTFATIPGIISPIITGHLVENKVRTKNYLFIFANTVQVSIKFQNLRPKRNGTRCFASVLEFT
jgi:hypothetical protein